MGDRIVEAFGKFMAQIDGEIITFDDRSSAETAVALNEGEAVMRARATNYCKTRGLEGKNAVAKTRIIMDFLAFEATLPLETSPGAEAMAESKGKRKKK